ncbi:MAG TPA: hypothetical protein VNO31_46345 [Umezawaea sp.]|nr:hypothetical protein [Umezawaea sp.]
MIAVGGGGGGGTVEGFPPRPVGVTGVVGGTSAWSVLGVGVAAVPPADTVVDTVGSVLVDDGPAGDEHAAVTITAINARRVGRSVSKVVTAFSALGMGTSL